MESPARRRRACTLHLSVSMKHLFELGLTCSLLCAACGTDDSSDEGAADPGSTIAEPGDPSASADPTVPSTDPAVPEAQGQTALSAPTITGAGSSTARVTTALAGAGLQIQGGAGLGSYVLATYAAGTGANRATAELTVNPASGASFVYMLLGSGTRYSTQQLRLQRIPGSNQLQAAATTGNVACGTLASDQPTAVTVTFDGATQTFDVLLAGAASACTHLPTRVQPPIVGFGMMDASNEDWGGRVDFTNLALR